MKNKSIRLALLVALPVLPACAMLMSPARPAEPDNRYVLDDATRARLQERLGEEVVRDVDTVYEAMREFKSLPYAERRSSYDPSGAVKCVEEFIKAKAFGEKGDEAAAKAAFHNCNYSCGNESDRPASPLREIGARYAPECEAGKLAGEAPRHLARFDAALAELEAASGAMNRHYAMAKLRGALRQATEGLGEDDPRIQSRGQQLDAASAEHAADLERVRLFLARPDVREVQRGLDLQRARVADLEKVPYKKEELRLAKDELHALEVKYSFLMGEAGL